MSKPLPITPENATRILHDVLRAIEVTRPWSGGGVSFDYAKPDARIWVWALCVNSYAHTVSNYWADHDLDQGDDTPETRYWFYQLVETALAAPVDDPGRIRASLDSAIERVRLNDQMTLNDEVTVTTLGRLLMFKTDELVDQMLLVLQVKSLQPASPGTDAEDTIAAVNTAVMNKAVKYAIEVAAVAVVMLTVLETASASGTEPPRSHP